MNYTSQKSDFTFDQAYKIQEQDLADWKLVLTESAFNELKHEVEEENERGYKSPFSVIRSGSLDFKVKQIIAKTKETNEKDYVVLTPVWQNDFKYPITGGSYVERFTYKDEGNSYIELYDGSKMIGLLTVHSKNTAGEYIVVNGVGIFLSDLKKIKI